MLEAREDLARAVEMYQAELSTNPSHGRAHLRLAQILKRQGDQAGYVDRLRRGVEQAPESGGCYFLLAHERLRAGDVEDALRLAPRRRLPLPRAGRAGLRRGGARPAAGGGVSPPLRERLT